MAVDSIDKAIVARLTSYAGLAALIGARVYPGYLPQGSVKPSVYYEEEATGRISTDDGDGEYRESEYLITAVADSYGSAKAVSAQIEAALARWTQSTPVEVTETLVSCDGTMPVEETKEWISVITVKIFYFAP